MSTAADTLRSTHRNLPKIFAQVSLPPSLLRSFHERRMRECPTYNYWYDMRTDVRIPESWLDAVNIILRRVRLVVVKVIDVDERTGKRTVRYRVEKWLAFLDRVHRQGRCDVCEHPKTEMLP